MSDELARLKEMRERIDALDEQLLELLSRRQEVVAEVVAFKKEHGMPVYHPAREADLIEARRESAARAGLDPDCIEEIFRNIMRFPGRPDPRDRPGRG